MDVISFCSELIKCQSVTPNDDGAIDCIDQFLSTIGFETNVMIFRSADGGNVVKNLFAKYGTSKSKVLGFLGHSDVVPPGDGWDYDPFDPVQKDGYLFGRGVTDMKGGIATFCCATANFIQEKFEGTIEILVTGDEEVGTYEGIQSLLDWCRETDHIPHDCLVGEPSSHKALGDRIYLGHRGSVNISVTSVGLQGHSAYPANFKNSLSDVCRFVARMLDYQWQHNDKRFPKTNLEPTLLFTNNYATNVVPDVTSANLNVRFGADYDNTSLEEVVRKEAENLNVSLDFNWSGKPFYCSDEKLKTILASSIKEITSLDATFSAEGGTSDARFIVPYCNSIEFGLMDNCMHQKNEKTKINDLINLERIYLSFLQKYF